MIDPFVSLAFAVYSNKGAYALLLGSGISRASGIPTGWEVVLDLIRKVAKLEGEDCEPDPAGWFRKKHGAEPDYSQLLDGIAKTPAERQQLLRGYFEPTEEERGQGLKLPSAAHKAIAQLVAAGYLRVIITTNFDRLMEKALEQVGVAPTVISTTDQLVGALPLTHSGATIIKLHGDYLDTRIKNTGLELAEYDKSLDRLLDRIFDEYGLIVSGWSGDWDIALRAAIERCPNRRFTTFWATRSPLTVKGGALATHRKAVIVQTKDANQFFDALREKVQALADLAAPHPLSVKMAAATVKRYLMDPSSKIRLRDLIHEETEKNIGFLTPTAFPNQNSKDHPLELISRLERYEALTEVLLGMFAVGGYWSDKANFTFWTQSLKRIASHSIGGDGMLYLIHLKRYPALLLMYSAGICAIAAERYDNLSALLESLTIRDNGKDLPAACCLNAESVVENKVGHLLPGMNRHYTPFSEYLCSKLREPLREYLPDDKDFQNAFDRFEYLLGLICADRHKREYQGAWLGSVGCFSWRGRDFGEDFIPSRIKKEFDAAGSKWGPLVGGLMGGDLTRASNAIERFNLSMGKLGYM